MIEILLPIKQTFYIFNFLIDKKAVHFYFIKSKIIIIQHKFDILICANVLSITFILYPSLSSNPLKIFFFYHFLFKKLKDFNTM